MTPEPQLIFLNVTQIFEPDNIRNFILTLIRKGSFICKDW